MRWVVCLNLPLASFDLIFLDPPYAQGLAEQALIEIEDIRLLSNDGIICVETGVSEVLSEDTGSLQRIDQRRYGTIMVSFYAHKHKG